MSQTALRMLSWLHRLRTPLFMRRRKLICPATIMADASIDTQAIPLQPFLAIYAPEQAANVSGQTEIHATLHGPLKKVNQLEAHLTIPILKVGYSNTIQLAAVSPIRVDYKNSVIDLQPATIRGTDTDLQLQGSIPISSGAPDVAKGAGNSESSTRAALRRRLAQLGAIETEYRFAWRYRRRRTGRRN